MNPSMKNQLIWVRVIGFAISITFLTWVPRLPEIKDHLGLGVSQLGQIFMVVGLVGLVSSKLNSWLLVNLGSRRMLFLAIPLGLFGNVLVATMSGVPQFIGGLVFCSLASFLSNTAAITQANNIRIATGFDPQANMSAIANIGSLFAMILGAACLSLIPPAFYIVGLSILASTAIGMASWRLAPKDSHDTVTGQPEKITMPWFGKTTGLFWIMVLAVFASTTAEFSVSDWGAILARDSFGIPAPFYLLPFVVFQAGVVSSRFATDHLGQKFGVARFVTVSTCSAALVWICALVVAASVGASAPWLTLFITLIGFTAGGWGVGPIWPVFISAINRGPFPPAVALPRFFSLVSLAFVLGPGVLGQLANWLTLPYALVVAAVMLFLAGTQSRKKVLGY